MIPPEAFEQTECDEVADGMASDAPRFASFDEAIGYVRARMPDEGVQLVDNVAWSLFEAQHDRRERHDTGAIP